MVVLFKPIKYFTYKPTKFSKPTFYNTCYFSADRQVTWFRLRILRAPGRCDRGEGEVQRQGAGRQEDAGRLQHHQARSHPHSRRVRRKTVSFCFSLEQCCQKTWTPRKSWNLTTWGKNLEYEKLRKKPALFYVEKP